MALEDVASSNEVPVISHGAGTVRFEAVGGDWLFRTYPSDSAERAAMARYVFDQGAHTAAVLSQNTESTQGITQVFLSGSRKPARRCSIA